MRAIRVFALAVSTLWVPAMFAQKWEIGVLGGGSFYTQKTLTNGSASAQAGFDNSYTVGGWVANNPYKTLGGEVRYEFQQNDARLASGGTQVTFGSSSHSILYNFLFYGGGVESRARPYILAGGGVRHYEGNGTETAYQPLSNIALLTKTSGYSALLSVGGGARFAVGAHGVVRVEFVDFIAPFPSQLIAPVPGTKGSGWIHNFVPSIGLAYTY